MSNPCHMCKYFNLDKSNKNGFGTCKRHPPPYPKVNEFDNCGESTKQKVVEVKEGE